MRVVSAKEIQRLDTVAIKHYGVPSIALMENAGRAVADAVIQRLQRKRKQDVCVVCGTGNNAGDGFVAARHLFNAEIRTRIFLVGKASQLKSDAAVNYKILKKLKYPIKEIRKVDQKILEIISQAGIVIDAIFGVGLNRRVEDPFKTIIEALNRSAKHIVAVDVPSGLNATTGDIYGVCVKAKETVTFSLPKKGFYKKMGPRVTGKVIVADIGIPRKIINS